MNHAWRLTFGYDGDAYTLVSMRRLLKRVPAGPPVHAGAVRRAIELRDAEQKVLYRRDICALVADTVEYPTGDPSRPLSRVALRRRREVSLLVPDLPQGHSVAIVAAAAASAGPPQAAAGAAKRTGDAARDLIAVELPTLPAADGEQR